MNYAGPMFSPRDNKPHHPRAISSSAAYVEGACADCEMAGCQKNHVQELLGKAAEIARQGRLESMSSALWCDRGGHAFSERDPGRSRMKFSFLDDNGDEIEDYQDMCGKCTEEAGTRHKKTAPKELPALDHYDIGRTSALESENDRLRRQQEQGGY